MSAAPRSSGANFAPRIGVLIGVTFDKEIDRDEHAARSQPRTLSGLAGLGDLVLTCNGELSRNRTVGVELGRGRGLERFRSFRSPLPHGRCSVPSRARQQAVVFANGENALEEILGGMRMVAEGGQTTYAAIA